MKFTNFFSCLSCRGIKPSKSFTNKNDMHKSIFTWNMCARQTVYSGARIPLKFEPSWLCNIHEHKWCRIYSCSECCGAPLNSTQLGSIQYFFLIFCNPYNLFSFFALSIACIFSTRLNNSLLYLIWFYISLFASSHKFFTIHIQLNATDENHGYHILFNAFSNNYSRINVFQCSLSPWPYERYERERVLKSHNERQLYELISMLTLTLNSYIA